jgi:peptidoglycan/LPS O-acetylase OafA/YrhL
MPFIMQFYLLWPLLNRFSQKYRVPGLLALAVSCLGVTFCINDFLVQRWSINLLESPVGHMPEICLGIAAARYGLRSRGIYAAIAALVFLARYLVGRIWLLSYITALIVMLWLYTIGRRWLKSSKVLQYLGRCSLAIFLVNGFIRVPFLSLALQYPNWSAGILFGILSAAAAVGVSHFLSPPRKKEVRALA